MAQLLVRDIGDAIVSALRKRAAQHGRSAEAEHREILKRALRKTQRLTFAEVLATMPDVGTDADFMRSDEPARAPHVFD